MIVRTVAAAACCVLALSPVVRADQQVAQISTSEITDVAPVPFAPGEKVVYGVSWGVFGRRGTASSEVVAVEDVRGRPTYHLSFRLRGSVLGLGVNDHQESWLDVSHLYSHRFKQELHQPRYDRLRTLDFFPSEMKWRQVERPDSGDLATHNPLDDVSFLYWARTLELEVGKRYEFRRYFKDSGNPVVIQVLRKERVTVPAGTFNTIVVRPLIRTSGLFAEGEAEIYFSDDADRVVVMMVTKLPIAKATMRLESYTPGRPLSGSGRPRP